MTDREQIDKVVREVLQRYVLHENNPETRRKIVHEIYRAIPVGETFQVICDSWNNGPEEIAAEIICCDVYCNDDNGGLVCMEFQADKSVLTADDRLKIEQLHAAKSKNTTTP